MDKINLSLLRGVCQTPAYVAIEQGLFAEEGIEAVPKIAPTAWMVPQQLEANKGDFAVIPWTRAVAANQDESKLMVVTGSGMNEAAIVVRSGLEVDDVKSVSVPMRGGMKDLTAMGLMKSLGWDEIEVLRQPSGDGTIVAFCGEGVDAASMVEPYATMLVRQDVGYVARRTGDIWPDAPGCSLTTSAELCATNPELVSRVVRAYKKATDSVLADPESAARIARKYVGVAAEHITQAIQVNPPSVDAIRSDASMNAIVELMIELGYLSGQPQPFHDLRFLEPVTA